MFLEHIRNLLRCVRGKISSRAFIQSAPPSDRNDGTLRALVYYKTAPFFVCNRAKLYRHTNNWEILEMVRILSTYGFLVDVVDRRTADLVLEDRYHLFIGIGSGDSGRHFSTYAKQVPSAVKILYTTGANPVVRRKGAIERYAQFTKRTGIHAEPMRTTHKLDFNEAVKYADHLCCFGTKDSFSFESYRACAKSIYPIVPGTSPEIRFDPTWLRTRDRTHFVCFAGSGFIYKGIDLLVEAFLGTPEYSLVICGPDSEPAFFEAYGARIASAPNIQYEGFVQVGSGRFEEICARASFVINYSSSEACSTAVATMMRAGLVPVVNRETSITIDDFGFLIESKGDDEVQTIRQIITQAGVLNQADYVHRVYRTLHQALEYSQAAFTKSFSEALLDIMEKENLSEKS